ncbi:TrkH family potassium uptake protein, partial [Staphylococcus epidermidis]|nr:TrkH family potassium uptake protein [Staphylococcus epidermidis]MBE7347739.1 TrkH family potassium uptake protein [Staphylococcus epidermidis]
DLTSEYYNWTEFIIIIVMLCGKIGLLNISRALVPPKDPKNYRYTKGHIHL